MNKLIIIGNGFDLAHGLNTSYKDFMLWYWNGVLEKLNSEQTYEDRFIKFNLKLFDVVIPNFKEYDNLKDVFEIINKFISPYPTIQPYELTFLSPFFRYLKNNLSINNWVDFETAYFKYLISVTNLRWPNNYFKPLNEEFEVIIQLFKTYLDTINPEINSTICETLKKVFEYDFDSSNNKTGEYSEDHLILNFNYTKTIKLYEDPLGFALNNIHLHGELDNPKNPIILGYSNNSDPNYKNLSLSKSAEAFKFIKSFLYNNNAQKLKLNDFLIKGNFKTIILGHSCGESDSTLLKEILGHPNCSNIQIYYKDYEDFSQKRVAISLCFGSEDILEKLTPYSVSSPLNPHP